MDEIHHGTVENDRTKSVANPRMIAILAYLGFLVVIPFLLDVRKDPFVKFHLKQGVALLIFEAIGWVIAIAIGWMPVFGWIITTIWSVVGLLLSIIGILNVLQGKEKELPLVGPYGNNFTF